jgi:hypothetical protein
MEKKEKEGFGVFTSKKMSETFLRTLEVKIIKNTPRN